jgi:folylpolyglutamate synthase
MMDVTSEQDSRKSTTRVLIFNCTNGRSGHSFLSAILVKTAAQLQQYGQSDDHETFFDHVIFCTNVTYADGGFKEGNIYDLPSSEMV